MDKRHDSSETWDLIIKPQKGFSVDLQLQEVWNYRELIYLFIRRNFVAYYKQTILGPLWYLITPFITTVVFTLIFGKLAKIPTDGIPPFLFYMAGNITWSYFATSFRGTSNTFVVNAAIFGKVYFPRLTVPISEVVIGLLKYTIHLVLFAGFYMYFAYKGSSAHLTIWIFYFPLIIIQMALLSLGLGIIISSLTTKYRDLTFLMTFGLQLWMYGTPIVYPASLVPDKYLCLYMMNPMAPIIETVRYAFLGEGLVDPAYISVSWGVTLFSLIAGILLFNKVEKTFMDTV